MNLNLKLKVSFSFDRGELIHLSAAKETNKSKAVNAYKSNHRGELINSKLTNYPL